MTEQYDLLPKDMEKITLVYKDLEGILLYSESEYELMQYDMIKTEHYHIMSEMHV